MGNIVCKVRNGFSLATALCLSLLFASQASAQVTLPDVGVDVSDTMTAIGSALGTIVAASIALFGAFLVVKYGLRWIRTATR